MAYPFIFRTPALDAVVPVSDNPEPITCSDERAQLVTKLETVLKMDFPDCSTFELVGNKDDPLEKKGIQATSRHLGKTHIVFINTQGKAFKTIQCTQEAMNLTVYDKPELKNKDGGVNITQSYQPYCNELAEGAPLETSFTQDQLYWAKLIILLSNETPSSEQKSK